MRLLNIIYDGFIEVIADISCPTCSVRLTSKSRFELHLDRQAPDKRFKCDTCSRFFSTEEILKEHQRGHVTKYDCPIKGCTHKAAHFSSLSKLGYLFGSFFSQSTH